MSDWPQLLALPDGLVTITPYHQCSLGGSMSGSLPSAPTSAAYVAANRALFYPFRLTRPFLAKVMFTINGATASNNVDVGIYSADGTRLVSKGSTAQAGTSSIQTYDITDTLLGPGLFYLAVAMDGTTGTLFRGAPTTLSQAIALGCAQQASAFALPAAATFATLANGLIYFVGVSGRAFV